MKLILDIQLAANYKSQSQKARILTECWVNDQIYCPNCGHLSIDKYDNNKPVADFFCPNCREDYELKSKQNSIGTKIVDGAYRTTIERLLENESPNLFLLNYDLSNFSVSNFFVVPKHFFIPEMIEKRKPLMPTARRAGWIGCNIILQNLPSAGKIFFVKNSAVQPKEKVLSQWQKTLFLRDEKEVDAKGWLLDIMACIEKLGRKDFLLNDVYMFEGKLSKLHPGNKHIKDKIRQQLQILRDKKYLEFVSRGKYQLI